MTSDVFELARGVASALTSGSYAATASLSPWYPGDDLPVASYTVVPSTIAYEEASRAARKETATIDIQLVRRVGDRGVHETYLAEAEAVARLFGPRDGQVASVAGWVATTSEMRLLYSADLLKDNVWASVVTVSFVRWT